MRLGALFARAAGLGLAVSLVFITGCVEPPPITGPDPGPGPTPAPVPSTPARRTFVGCYAAGAGSGSLGCGVGRTLGDPAADAAFLSEIQYQSQFWGGVPATVYVLDECQPEYANAYALPSREILFGRHLFHKLARQYGNGLPISGVLAHEWGHQVQFAYGWMNAGGGTVRPTELEADAFAGYFMALAKSWAWPLIGSYFQSVYNSGDTNFNHPSHHGTHQERLAAARLGFEAAGYAIRLGRPLHYVELHQAFRQQIQGFGAATAAPPVNDLAAALQGGEALAIARGETEGSDGPGPRGAGSPSLFPAR